MLFIQILFFRMIFETIQIVKNILKSSLSHHQGTSLSKINNYCLLGYKKKSLHDQDFSGTKKEKNSGL